MNDGSAGANDPNTHLSLQLGSQLITLAFVIVGTLGAIIWDILSNINADYRILHDFPMTIPTAIYFLSRVATFVAFMLTTISITQPIKNCGIILYSSSWIFAFSLSCTTLLFFFRVRAVYLDNKYLVAFFFLLWLAVVVGCIVETQRGVGSSAPPPNGGPNNYCLDNNPINLKLITVVTTQSTIPMVNDVLSFCAITWRLMRNSHVETSFKNGIRVMLLGRYLPAFSRALLQDGQAYLLYTVSLAILSTAAFYSPVVPRAISLALVYPNIAVMNLMGCKIFRHTKLELRRLSRPISTTQSIAFHDIPTAQNSAVD